MMTKGAVWALGTMSGTSLDGVDAALVKTDGQVISEFGDSKYRAYSTEERDLIRARFGTWDGGDEAAEMVETAHADLCTDMPAADVIGFHGQTVAHDPAKRRTRQLGDGRVLAEVLQTPVVWDFRTMDVEMGGEGAPLAPFFHFAAAKWIDAKSPLAFLNLGGVGNLTWVDPSKDRPEDDGACLAFDTGPANAPINDLIQTRLGQSYDLDGALARMGKVEDGVLEDFLEHPYFFRMAPKSLDRDAFADLGEAVKDLSDADAAATLTAAAAAAVAKGIELCPAPPHRILVTGGGRKNTVLMEMLKAALGNGVQPVETVGLDGDMLEAQAFAYLAVRVMNGLPTSGPSTTGVATPVGGGQIARPKLKPLKGNIDAPSALQ